MIGVGLGEPTQTFPSATVGGRDSVASLDEVSVAYRTTTGDSFSLRRVPTPSGCVERDPVIDDDVRPTSVAPDLPATTPHQWKVGTDEK